jgi:nitroimidazol reductase NimA-like FMN-containing flavoprotein (pyridoxamine 5'-phosphate oxidase superfamily)
MIGAMGSYEHPSSGLDEPLDCYIHGYVSSRIMNLATKAATEKGEEEGLPVCICASIVDGIVLSLTPNTHDYNYRSAIIHGYASLVTDNDEKLWAMELVTNGVVGDRWANSRTPPDSAEMSSTRILKVRVVAGSAKVRQGMPNDDKKDTGRSELVDNIWTGVLPIYETIGEPIPSPLNKVKEVPEHIKNWIAASKENEKYSIAVTQVKPIAKPAAE